MAFDEDESGNVYLDSGSPAAVEEPTEVAATVLNWKQDDSWTTIDPAFTFSDLRSMLMGIEYSHRAETQQGKLISPTVRRIRERRVNKTLSTVANWLLVGANQFKDNDPATAGFLVTLSEDVRNQIQWSELEAYMKQTVVPDHG